MTKLLIALLILLIATPIISVGCQEEGGQLPAPSSPGELSSTLVPDVPLDLYIYARQDGPTAVPAGMVGTPDDIEVEALSVWGISAEDEFALGMGLSLTSDSDAAGLYDEINLEENGWKLLSGSTIYLVHGSGAAAESLKTAISNNDFKYYDDGESLEAVATLPDYGTTRPAAIALAKPSVLISFIARDADSETLERIDMILKLVNLKLVAAGLYSPQQIDIARIVAIMGSDGNISNLNLGVLILVKSGLPGLLVEPAVKKFLTEFEFTEIKIGGFAVYEGSWDTGKGGAIPVLVRIEGNYIFAAVAGQDSYAQALITSVNK